MTIEAQNLRVSQQLEAYTKRPLSKRSDGTPLLLARSDKNASALVAEMNRLYPGQALTLQRCLDLILSQWGRAQLEWTPDPSYRKPEAPQPTPPPSTPRDTRTKEQKLQDAGYFPTTHKATAQDVKDEEARHKEARERLKALFTDDPERVEFDDALKAANAILISTGPRIFSRVKSFEAREKAREELRKRWPQYASLAVQPDSEKMNHRPGVF